jgi:hypothetical protein
VNAIYAISTGSASPQDAPVYVGLSFVVLGVLALWYCNQCYLAYQLIRPYPSHDPIYVLIQFAVPALAVVGGIGSVAVRFVGS